MVTDYKGKERTGECNGTKADGKKCERKVTFSIVKPYGDPMTESQPYCADHRDQQPDPLKVKPNPVVEGF